MVPGPEFQEKVITEAIANWSAEKIVLDEIKRLNDALALEEGSKTGVGFSATVHARSLEEALERKAYAPLFGNVDLATRTKLSKVSFGVIIQLVSRTRVIVYSDANEAIESFLCERPADGNVIDLCVQHYGASVKLSVPSPDV
jgi:stage III sporulation protein SpoIIIAA